MLTINDMLTAEAKPLGRWELWTNDVMGQLGALTVKAKTPIEVNESRTEFTSWNGHEWECNHVSSTLTEVTVDFDGIGWVHVCDGCGKQYNQGEWL